MAQPSNLWTVAGSVPFFVVFFRSSGCTSRQGLQEEPPSLRAEREGDQEFPWLFVRPSRNLFIRKEGFVCRNPLEGEPRSLGLGKVCRESPRASARSERAVWSSPGFLCDPHASFSFGRRGGICHATLGGRER